MSRRLTYKPNWLKKLKKNNSINASYADGEVKALKIQKKKAQLRNINVEDAVNQILQIIQ